MNYSTHIKGALTLLGSFAALSITMIALAQESQTGILKIERINSKNELGKAIDVEVVTSSSGTHKTQVTGSSPSTTLTLPKGWVQVNCRPLSGSGGLGHSVLIRSGKSLKVACYFKQSPKSVAPLVELLVDNGVNDLALSGLSSDSVTIGSAPSRKSEGLSRNRKFQSARSDSGPRVAIRRKARGPRIGALQAAPPPTLSRESYDFQAENRFREVKHSPTSTFSIDVDTASYANARRYIEKMNSLPPSEAVRIEEFINYFNYQYGEPSGDLPFSTHTEVAVAPWNPAHRLVHVGLKAKSISADERPPSNLVFLIDVSGSMRQANKLPLLKSAFSLLVEQLTEQDRVSIVVYASRQGLVLSSTPGNQKAKILGALNQLSAGGSTDGGAGIELAYRQAAEHFIKGGNNRVILATDGDFNVGVTSAGGLVKLIQKKRESGVFLSVLGFGRGNYKDATMEQLSNHGNGVAAYIDSLAEARKVLVDEAGGSLVTVAKDVKVQVEFNPAKVSSYRLIGYANRQLKHEDFKDDKKDAGDMGAGHTVTVLYEVIPRTDNQSAPGAELRYQKTSPTTGHEGELMTLKVRYKKPASNISKLEQRVVIDHSTQLSRTSDSFRFAAAVAQFGMLLGHSKHSGTASMSAVIAQAQSALGNDPKGYRKGFVSLAQQANRLMLKAGMPE